MQLIKSKIAMNFEKIKQEFKEDILVEIIEMTRESAYRQYLNEVSAFEKYGSLSIISFEDWLDIKGIEVDNENDETK